MNPSFTPENLAALNDAIAQGALRVRYSDKEVQYRSLDEMLRIRGIMQRDLGITPAGSGRVYARFNNGI